MFRLSITFINKIMEFIEHLQEYTLYERSVSRLVIISKDHSKELKTLGSFWVMSHGGSATLDNIKVQSSTWVAGGFKNIIIEGPALVIENAGFELMERKCTSFTPGQLGQLSYIDGCSNSNLVDPMRNGDPCINYLFFPPGIDQTWHTHPSVRIGYVTSGRGFACIKDGDREEELELTPGKMFILHRHTKHRFRTAGNNHMSLMVYHPDSEDGPRDENNPMKSRTYIR